MFAEPPDFQISNVDAGGRTMPAAGAASSASEHGVPAGATSSASEHGRPAWTGSVAIANIGLDGKADPGSTSGEPGSTQWMIIAVGLMTEHWDALWSKYRSVANWCLDLRNALHREYDETTDNDGFSQSTRDRMRSKEAWNVVWEASMCVLRVFGLLVLGGNHGKHILLLGV